MTKPFTGRHMALIFVGGFGIVIGVNALMATLALRGFGGVVVKNSYVASQNFNSWLKEADAQDKLGWDVEIARLADGTLSVATRGVPADAKVTASARRPLGDPETREFAFLGNPESGFSSVTPLPKGRWLLRLSVVSGSHHWRRESRLE